MAWDDITQYSWLHPRRSPAENLALGAQTGATIRSAWTQRHADTRAAQMLPFQMYAAEQQARAAAYEVDSAMRKMQEEDSLNAGLSELSKITAGIAETGNWESPESRRKIRELGIKYPKMTITQPYLAALGQTEVSRMERLKLMHEMANIEAAEALADQRRGAIDLEDERQSNREALEDLRHKNRIALEDLRQKGREGLRDARGRIITFDEFWNRHINTFLVPRGSRETKEAWAARQAEAMAEMRSFYDAMKGQDGTSGTSVSPPTSSRLRYDPQRRILIDPSTGGTYQFRP